MSDAFFLLFGAFTILCSLVVVCASNVIFSAFGLVSAFFGLAALYVMWGSDLIATLQILIYTGAIVVLFVFVVMLLDFSKVRSLYSSNTFLVLGTMVSVFFLAVPVLRSLNRAQFSQGTDLSAVKSLEGISSLLFTDHLWAFEILSVFLLALILSVCILVKPHVLIEQGRKERRI